MPARQASLYLLTDCVAAAASTLPASRDAPSASFRRASLDCRFPMAYRYSRGDTARWRHRARRGAMLNMLARHYLRPMSWRYSRAEMRTTSTPAVARRLRLPPARQFVEEAARLPYDGAGLPEVDDA